MIRYLFIAALLLTPAIRAQHTDISHVLNSIELNNKELQATRQLTEARKLETRTDNNLPDPTVSYSYLWGKHDRDATISELVVSQSFDFPTLYISRSKLSRQKMHSLDSQEMVTRRDILLRAKEVCLDIIMLYGQKEMLEERLRNAAGLSAIYAERLRVGDANVLETNKINLELLNVKTEAAMNEAALRNKQGELATLNGDIPLEFGGGTYPPVAFPAGYQQLRDEVMATDREIEALAREASVAGRQVSINKSYWLPKLELGYRRNTESGDPFNGLIVGFSIPLFENRNKVKMAKAQSLTLSYLKESATLEVESELMRLYNEAQASKASMEEYEKTFAVQSDMELLGQALNGGEISMIEYFVEVSVVYQSKLNYLLLQNQYQKAMARIYKNRL